MRSLARRSVALLVPVLSLFALAARSTWAAEAIVVDGRFEDWSGRDPLVVDLRGDAASGGPDFGRRPTTRAA